MRQRLRRSLSKSCSFVVPQQIALRAKIILLADKGKNNREIERSLNISRYMVQRWRNRWLDLSDRSLSVIERLQDSERSGTPTKYSMEQVVDLFALACSEPVDYGRPISHWMGTELAVQKQGFGCLIGI
ncbi:MAG: helix-turn-helix domain-containing protein [Nostoc sp.]|uniref:helix-turn-helix domain-containing protein n=1 Tax=Nostoc sp. TaxID=1180 RepID=UPI002FF8C11E